MRALSTTDVEDILRQLYGVSASANQLPGELDLNFHVRTDSGDQYLLKIYPPGRDGSVLDLQNKALAYLESTAPDLCIPRVVTTQSGDEIGVWVDATGATGSTRLLTWLSGKLWAEAKPDVAKSGPELGAFLAKLDKTLVNFSHPTMVRDYLWGLQQIGRQLEVIEQIEPVAMRETVGKVISRLTNDLSPQLAVLPKQVIHNDANDHNIVLEADGSPVGLIDFNDMLYSYRASELAVACAYAMLDQSDPVGAVLPMVAAYHADNPLQEDEIELLFDLIQGRIATSICMAARQIVNDPDNEYLLVSQKPFRALLEHLATENRELAIYRFRDACGLPANSNAPKIIRWLEQNRHQFARVCDFDLSDPSKLLTIDLSVDGSDMQDVDASTSTAEFSEHLFRKIQNEGANVGIGRYLERRSLYKSDRFLIADSMEQRDIHLGIDLFMPAGEPIYAPLNGKIEAFANNSDRYDFGPVVILRHDTDDGIPLWTLYGHLSEHSLDRLRVGQAIEQGGLVGWIGNYPNNGDWPPHLHFQLLTTLLAMGTRIHGVATIGQLDVWESISPDPNLLLGIPFSCRAGVSRSSEYLTGRRRRFLGKMLSLFYARPIKIVRGKGQYLYDDRGNRWLDMINNVCHVGHCHPYVVAAGQAQMAQLNTNTRFLHDNIAEYVQRLVATFPPPLSVCFFVNSGSEANDLALRLAWTYTKRRDLLVVEHSYHGHLSSLIDISHYKFAGKGGAGCPDYIWTTPCPDGYRGRFRYADPEVGRHYASTIKLQIDVARDRPPAALIAESLGGVAGQIIPPPGYLQHAYEHVRAAGGLCIADEVQVGFGRVGSAMWAFETQGVIPDIVTLGKPIGNGHPLAAVITRPEIADAFNTGMEYFNTFGGNPVSCAIGLAVLEVIRNENLAANATHVGGLIKQGLESLQQKHLLIGDVRGMGLFLGAELVRDRNTLEPATEEANSIVEALKHRGILLSTDGPLDNVLKIKPPMCITSDDADFFIGALDKALAKLN